MIDMTGQRSAKVKTHVVAGTTYRGANPEYYNIADVGMPAHYVKVAKGVPWRKVTDN